MTLQLTRRPLRTKHAILNDELMSLWDCVQKCLDEHISHLWVLSDNCFTREYYESWLPWCTEQTPLDVLPHWSQDGTQLASIVGHRVTPRSHRFNIIFCEHSSWAFLPACQDDPARLLDIIAELERNLGVPMGGSPAGVGTRYLRASLPEKQQHWLEAPKNELFSLMRFEARPLISQRAISAREAQEADVLLAIDKNAAYPRAAKDASLGIGEPEIRDGECFFAHEARVLSKWTKYLWEKRMLYPQGHMRASYKQIMNDTIGLFRSKEVKGSWKYRPDWYSEIVNYSNMLIKENMSKFAREMQIWPAIVHIDALYYLLTREASEKLLNAISGHAESLGGYKVKFQLPLDETFEGETVRTIIQSDRPQAGQNGKLYCFNRIAERLGYK